MASEFIEIAQTVDVPLGRVKAFSIGERRVAIYHTVNGFFASDNACPHRGGPLSEGDLIGDEIVCPWHLWGYMIDSGANTGGADACLTTHEVRIEGERILLRLTPELE